MQIVRPVDVADITHATVQQDALPGAVAKTAALQFGPADTSHYIDISAPLTIGDSNVYDVVMADFSNPGAYGSATVRYGMSVIASGATCNATVVLRDSEGNTIDSWTHTHVTSGIFEHVVYGPDLPVDCAGMYLHITITAAA